jgi:hypothetical protein
MKRALAFSLVLAAHAASADPRHTLVLKSEGNASADVRGKVDVQVLKLAKSVGGNVEAGEVSFSDATTMVGCNPSESSCKDQVLETLGVDEIVVTNVDKAPGGGLKITVRRIPKSGMPSEQTTLVPGGQAPDAKLNSDVGPLFGAAEPPPKPDKPSDASIGAALGATAGGDSAATTPAPTPAPTEPAATTLPAPVRTAQVDTVTAAPNNQVAPAPEDRVDHRRLELTGMAVGGGLVLLSLIMWAEAGSMQSDIDAAPTKTANDFKNLTDLENQADTYAGLGNVMFVGGVVVAGVSTYFWWRDRTHASTHQARIAPAVFDHGAGLTLSFGGGR